jgi:hypothetical protein
MTSRKAQLEATIRQLTVQRDAQPADTLYALTHQKRIDKLSIELMAWQLDGPAMRAAETAIRDAAHRRHRAHTGRSRWPAAAGVTGVLGTLATAGQLAADTSHPPLIGGSLLAVAAAALGLTVAERLRDSRAAAEAETEMNTAQRQYSAVIARHAHAIAPMTPVAIHEQETSCAPTSTPSPRHPQSVATSTSTTPASRPAPAATSGRPPTASALSATSWAAAG